jgi:RES domain-containing protein
LYRVVRRGWKDPLDASFSQRRPDRRWNTAGFPALYCCCSERVARAVTLDVFQWNGVEWEELQEDYRPELAEISWSGQLVDMSSARGIEAAGFPSTYPTGVAKTETRQAASRWHDGGAEGVVCRSASLARRGHREWEGAHELWSELAVFPQNARRPPLLLGRRSIDSPGERGWLVRR